jgi:hypothetical protein
MYVIVRLKYDLRAMLIMDQRKKLLAQAACNHTKQGYQFYT